MNDNNKLSFGDKMLLKARRTSDNVFYEYYNKTEEERNTSEKIDKKICYIMSKCFLLGVKSCISDIETYFEINDALKQHFT